jgi:spermidine synthase
MRFQQLALFTVVACAGVAVMGLEMSASRLIAPYFGSTLSVWTSLIGLILAFLTLGYYLGGALADRWPRRPVLAAITFAAGALVCVIPLIAMKVLPWSWSVSPRLGLLGGSFVATFVLFLVPVTLLGCIPPFAMRLYISDLTHAGRSAGRIYAISAAGSIVGTFLPAMVTLPLLGARRSIMAFGLLLIAGSLPLLGRARWAAAAAPLAALLFLPLKPMLPVQGLVVERETPYNYLQVIRSGDRTLLLVDWGVFSIYAPGRVLTDAYYDYLLMAPLLRPPPPAEWMRRVLIIGLGAGTSAKQISAFYGPVPIDGVEIDPGIVRLGRERFAMNEKNLHVYVTDGRWFVGHAVHPYNWVIIDAYQRSDIPFHLASRQFFQQLKAKMSPGGVVSINLAWIGPGQTEVRDLLVRTLQTAFPRVYVVPVPENESSAVILAGPEDCSPANLTANARQTYGGQPALAAVAARTAAGIEELAQPACQPLTDDLSPLEPLVDRMYRQARMEAFEREKAALEL